MQTIMIVEDDPDIRDGVRMKYFWKQLHRSQCSSR